MITLRPTIDTEQRFLEAISNAKKLARPTAALRKDLQRAILSGFADNFASESAAGFKWQRLSAVTIADRLAHGFGPGPILVRSGGYRASWIEPDSADHVSELQTRSDGWTMLEGSRHHFAATHEVGLGRVPARPARVLDQHRVDELGQITLQFLMDALSRRG
jgi:hypothetical protein